jgi:tetratricopeptide (TPR) repeat protein
MVKSNRSSKAQERIVLLAYYAVLILFLLASFFPQYRVWGFNWWAYYPPYVPWFLFAAGAVAPLVLRFIRVRDESSNKHRLYFLAVIGLVAGYGLAFYLLRARMHFLGDGYTLLSQLASHPVIKPRELGEMLAHVWVKNLIGGDGEAAALLTFQIISITAGILFLIVVAVCAGFLFERTKDRILFTLGLATGGYMLLFFGYVENYSLFVFTVTLYSLTGLLAVKGKLSRWLILPPLALAIFFHVLGVTLIPSAVYLLLVNSKLGEAIARLSLRAKLLMSTAGVVAVVLVFYHFYSIDYFFRFAIVPLFENRFTIEGYTMFSLKHIVDYFNLLILLLPGLPIVAVVLFFSPLKKMLREREYRYLTILFVSTLGAIFIFDPKLGMPRDWDLFSFAGVPLALISYYLLFNCHTKIISRTTIVVLAVLLGCFSLFPRVGSQMNEEMSSRHFIDLLDLDKVRNRIGRVILVEYYQKLGKGDKVALLYRRWDDLIQRDTLLTTAVDSINQNKFQPAVPLLYDFLDFYPQSHEAWQKLGICYLMMGQYDTALACLNLSDGINPYNPFTQYYIGLVHYERKEYCAAKDHFLEAIDIDGFLVLAWRKLAACYIAWNKPDSARTFTEIAERLNPPDAKSLYDMGAAYFLEGEYNKAEDCFLRVLEKDSLHSEALNGLANVYMQVKDQAKWTAVLLRLATLEDAKLELLKRVAEFYLKVGEYGKAAETYQRALQKGLDSSYVETLIQQHPQLKLELRE